MEIGRKIRYLRLQMGLTQEELAERSDLTKGFISQLERDQTSPSLDTLEAIIVALGSNLATFFQETEVRPLVFRAEEASTAVYAQMGMEMSWIVPTAQRWQMEPILLSLQPQGGTKTYDPYEGESFGYILQGTCELQVGERKEILQAGDCFYFSAEESFCLRNPSDEAARLLWILSPPNF